MAAQDIADNLVAGSLRREFPPAVLLALLAVLCAFGLLLGGIALFGRASDGEPVARLDFSLAPAHRAAEAQPPSRPMQHVVRNTNLTGAGSLPAAPPAARPGPPPAATATPPAQASPGLPPALVTGRIDKPVYDGHALIADPALIEATPDGPLPRIADDGRTPMTAYAPAVPAGSRPRIALVISGLGISARQTAAALEKLPPQVTLAFAPYSDDVQHWVSEARRLGHEVLLEVPMEPFDFPDSDPGPHTLRAAVSEETNTERLTWSLTRFTGYAGVTNLLGGRFLADSDSLAPVMTFLARRGLLFFDSSPESRSVAPDVARQVSAPYVQSKFAVDSIQTAMEIDARLSELESRARSASSAAGTGFVYPVTVERVTAWANGLSGRGFVLVPASAIVPRTK
jgi:polysaccharide deacetylase 2 family uncharacterized protein YibQ